MNDDIDSKYSRLLEILSGYGDMALAFSGGKDSVLLLKAGADALGKEKVVGVTAVSPIRRAEERRLARRLAAKLEVPAEFVYTTEYKNPIFVENETVERCFICKAELYTNLETVAERYAFKTMVDGTNLDDSLEDRPVFEVARRFGIRWPLVDAGIGSREVGLLLRRLGLPQFARPHYSCSAWDIDLRDIGSAF